MKSFFTSIILFAFLVSLCTAKDVKKVLVMVKSDLSEADLPGVKSQIDAIKSIDMFTWEFTYLLRSEIKNFSDFASYDLAYMTENVSSSYASDWGLKGVKSIPTLCYKSYALLKTNKNWPWIDNINSSNNWWDPTGTIPNTDAISETKVKINANHPILNDLGLTTGGSFSLASKVDASLLGKIAFQTFNITDDANIVANATAVGSSDLAEKSPTLVKNLLYAIEENASSKRTVLLGTAQGYLANPTAEMNRLTTGAVKWLLHIATGAENMNQASFFISIYPNPSNKTTAIQFAVKRSTTVNIRVADILGQNRYEYSSFFTQGTHQKVINVSDYKKGIYFIAVQIDGCEQTEKMVVN